MNRLETILVLSAVALASPLIVFPNSSRVIGPYHATNEGLRCPILVDSALSQDEINYLGANTRGGVAFVDPFTVTDTVRVAPVLGAPSNLGKNYQRVRCAGTGEWYFLRAK